MQTHIPTDMIKLVQSASTHPQDGARPNVEGELPTLDFLTELGQLRLQTPGGTDSAQPKSPLIAHTPTSQTAVFTHFVSMEGKKFLAPEEAQPAATQKIEPTPELLPRLADTAPPLSLRPEFQPTKDSSADFTLDASKISDVGEMTNGLPRLIEDGTYGAPNPTEPLASNNSGAKSNPVPVPPTDIAYVQTRPTALPENVEIRQAAPQEFVMSSAKQQPVSAGLVQAATAPIIPVQKQDPKHTEAGQNQVKTPAAIQPPDAAVEIPDPTKSAPAPDQKLTTSPLGEVAAVARPTPAPTMEQAQDQIIAKPLNSQHIVSDKPPVQIDVPSKFPAVTAQSSEGDAIQQPKTNSSPHPQAIANSESPDIVAAPPKSAEHVAQPERILLTGVAATVAKTENLDAATKTVPDTGPKPTLEATHRQAQIPAAPAILEADFNIPPVDNAKSQDRQAPLVLPTTVQTGHYTHSNPVASVIAARHPIEIERARSDKSIQTDPLSPAPETPKTTAAPVQISSAPLSPIPYSQMPMVAGHITDPKPELADDALLELTTATQTQTSPRETTRGPAELPIARHVANQVIEAARALPNGPVEIALNPEELGRVRLSLSTNDGAITLVVTAERTDTAELLRRNMDSLGQDFRDLGYEDISFAFAGDGNNQNADTDEQSPQSGSPKFISETDRTSPEPTRITLGTGVDIRL